MGTGLSLNCGDHSSWQNTVYLRFTFELISWKSAASRNQWYPVLMRSIALALLFFLLPGLGNAAEPALPDLLFLTGSSFGGYGRLVFSESAGRYQLLDGRIITHVVDGQQIRLMRADEGGGSMANPTKVVALDGKLFGNSTYGQLNELDPVTGAIGEKYSIGPFGFGASGSTAALFASDKALLIFERGKLIALDSRLKKLGEKSLEQAPRHVMLSPEFAQEGDKLHNVVIDNPKIGRAHV